MSNEAKWTPGPWVVFGAWGIQDQNNRLIAQFEPLNDDGNGNSEESFANAHLIAAAPELYEALIRVQQEGGMGIGLHRQIDRVMAKARGEQ